MSRAAEIPLSYSHRYPIAFMRIAFLNTFGAKTKEPLVSLIDRIHQAFLSSGLGEPMIRFDFVDSPLASPVSGVDKALEHHPEAGRFVTTASPAAGIPGARRISNGPWSRAAGEELPYKTLQTIAAGVPTSFPFHAVVIHFHSPEFGDRVPTQLNSAEMMAGVLLADSWWVDGRIRSLSACVVLPRVPGSRKMPPPSAPVAAVLKVCGKIKRTIPVPLAKKDVTRLAPVSQPTFAMIPGAAPEAMGAVLPHSLQQA